MADTAEHFFVFRVFPAGYYFFYAPVKFFIVSHSLSLLIQILGISIIYRNHAAFNETGLRPPTQNDGMLGVGYNIDHCLFVGWV